MSSLPSVLLAIDDTLAALLGLLGVLIAFSAGIYGLRKLEIFLKRQVDFFED